MNIQVNKDQLDRVVIKWLNKYFSNLTPKKYKDVNSVFYLNSNNEILMEYNKENKYIFIHHKYIWSYLGSLFHLKYDEIQSIIKVWLKETYKLRKLEPAGAGNSITHRWRKLNNWND